jgi:hypothetical protein
LVAVWLASATPSWHDRLRLMDGTPVRCGASRTTVNRSQMGEMAGYGRDASHQAFSWGAELMLITTADVTATAFSLAHLKEPRRMRTSPAAAPRPPDRRRRLPDRV